MGPWDPLAAFLPSPGPALQLDAHASEPGFHMGTTCLNLVLFSTPPLTPPSPCHIITPSPP